MEKIYLLDSNHYSIDDLISLLITLSKHKIKYDFFKRPSSCANVPDYIALLKGDKKEIFDILLKYDHIEGEQSFEDMQIENKNLKKDYNIEIDESY